MYPQNKISYNLGHECHDFVSELQWLDKNSRIFIKQQNRCHIYIQRTKFHTYWAMNDLISSVSELQSLDKNSRIFISPQNSKSMPY
ncbi:hypothetical protein BKA69DRAFT_1129871 [Paraphysoderma sedebokerense]|nr:hypothetical protein BKA69DRAFT_1129871 [Paraphysoderma sedebokerense]